MVTDMKGILGKKLGMTQIFDEAGRLTPVTVIEAGPCPVLQVKTAEKDGYSAAQIGFGESKRKRFVREIRLSPDQKSEKGQTVKVDIFKQGGFVDVTGTSIGKGFQGGVKKWHWKGGPKTHGSMQHRKPGSIGASADPSRVFKGQHMPGRMGGYQVTMQNAKVVKVDAENNLLLVRGAVPGPDGGFLIIKQAKKKPFIKDHRPSTIDYRPKTEEKSKTKEEKAKGDEKAKDKPKNKPKDKKD